MERRFDQAPIIESPISLSLTSLPPVERKNKIKSNNILVFWENLHQGDFLTSDDPQLLNFISTYQNLGFSPFGDMLVLHAVAHQLNKNGIKIPYEGECKTGHGDHIESSVRRKIGKERKQMFDGITSHLKFKKEESGVNIYEDINGELHNITSDIYGKASIDIPLVQELSTYDSFSGYASHLAQDFVHENSGLIVFLRNTKSLTNEPYIVVRDNKNSVRQMHSIPDVTLDPNQPVVYRSLRETISFSRNSQRRSDLVASLETGKIQTMPAFNKDNWPKHPILDRIKQQLVPMVNSYISEKGLVCDPLDLEYQALFRLTTYNLTDIFIGGDELINYCINAGAYESWRKILTLDPSVISGFQISSELVNKVLKEQARVIQDRLKRSSLPIDKIVVPSGIFAESGWEIMKDGDGVINTVQKDSNGTIVNAKRVLFRPVDTDLASRIHNDLHYIHTPRTDIAFGFFLEDEQLPFTTLAISKIDRAYKQNALLLFGFDPRNSIDFTRLYSRPGVPKNASSAIFGETFSYIRHNHPNIEAAMSAFMPSYASGLSMLTGGFETPILAKPNIHYFYDAKIDDETTMEHLTKRRQTMKGVNFVSSTLPLLPTVELLSPIHKPRFTPILQTGKDMILVQ